MSEEGTIARGRLAPSPTGALHLGNARSFLITWLSLRSQQGQMILRMEDLDHPKVKPGAAAAAMDDLRWLGLDWDEGPDCGGLYGPYTQSERVSRYQSALQLLRESGSVYPCVCSRRDVETAQSAPHKGDEGPRYPGTCRGRFADYAAAQAILPSERLPAWRYRALPSPVTFVDGYCGRVTTSVDEVSGDFVLARHPDGAGYMLAVVVDDAAMRITEVIRGDDLLPATPRQLLLYRALGLHAPAFIHVPLVVGTDGRRLAKRHGDTRIAALRERGVSAEKIVGLLAYWCGWASWGEVLTPHALLERFDWGRLSPAPAVFTEKVRAYLDV